MVLCIIYACIFKIDLFHMQLLSGIKYIIKLLYYWANWKYWFPFFFLQLSGCLGFASSFIFVIYVVIVEMNQAPHFNFVYFFLNITSWDPSYLLWDVWLLRHLYTHVLKCYDPLSSGDCASPLLGPEDQGATDFWPREVRHRDRADLQILTF